MIISSNNVYTLIKNVHLNTSNMTIFIKIYYYSIELICKHHFGNQFLFGTDAQYILN